MNEFDVEVKVHSKTTYIVRVKARSRVHAMEKVRDMDLDKFQTKAEFIDSEDGDFEVTHAEDVGDE